MLDPELQKLPEEASGPTGAPDRLDLFESREMGTPVTKVSGLRLSRLTGVPEVGWGGEQAVVSGP